MQPTPIQENIQNQSDPLFLENQTYIPRLQKFFCCISSDGAAFCCCGCSLNCGVVTLCILGFITLILQLFSYQSIPNLTVIISILIVLSFLGYLLIMISICNKRALLAYWGYISLSFVFWIKILLYIIVDVIIGVNIDKYYGNTNNSSIFWYYLLILIISNIIDVLLSFYYLYVFFSYCKKLAACDFNGLNGIYNTNQIGYTNIVPGNPIAPVNLSQNYQQVPNNNRLNTVAPTYSNDNNNNNQNNQQELKTIIRMVR